ncbi:hypothetical protein M2372_002083 [Chryseobacterium sp. BIGb0232]|nr:hypothetical protein [Chryseobacterium sp. BIGb0232]ROS17293.1 hypothetical protein EDF65_1657 [Chryseobacterium nakagawai]
MNKSSYSPTDIVDLKSAIDSKNKPITIAVDFML